MNKDEYKVNRDLDDLVEKMATPTNSGSYVEARIYASENPDDSSFVRVKLRDPVSGKWGKSFPIGRSTDWFERLVNHLIRLAPKLRLKPKVVKS